MGVEGREKREVRKKTPSFQMENIFLPNVLHFLPKQTTEMIENENRFLRKYFTPNQSFSSFACVGEGGTVND